MNNNNHHHHHPSTSASLMIPSSCNAALLQGFSSSSSSTATRHYRNNKHTASSSSSLPLSNSNNNNNNNHRHHGIEIVREALDKYEAAWKIRTFVYRCKTIKKVDGTNKATNSSIISRSETNHCAHVHWLWKSLLSYSKMERAAACQLLFDYACRQTQTTAAAAAAVETANIIITKNDDDEDGDDDGGENENENKPSSSTTNTNKNDNTTAATNNTTDTDTTDTLNYYSCFRIIRIFQNIMITTHRCNQEEMNNNSNASTNFIAELCNVMYVWSWKLESPDSNRMALSHSSWLWLCQMLEIYSAEQEHVLNRLISLSTLWNVPIWKYSNTLDSLLLAAYTSQNPKLLQLVHPHSPSPAKNKNKKTQTQQQPVMMMTNNNKNKPSSSSYSGNKPSSSSTTGAATTASSVAAAAAAAAAAATLQLQRQALDSMLMVSEPADDEDEDLMAAAEEEEEEDDGDEEASPPSGGGATAEIPTSSNDHITAAATSGAAALRRRVDYDTVVPVAQHHHEEDGEEEHHHDHQDEERDGDGNGGGDDEQEEDHHPMADDEDDDEDDEDDDDEEENDIVDDDEDDDDDVDEMTLDELQAVVVAQSEQQQHQHQQQGGGGTSDDDVPPDNLQERQVLFVQAAFRILQNNRCNMMLLPPGGHHYQSSPPPTGNNSSTNHHNSMCTTTTTTTTTRSIWTSIVDMVDPPSKKLQNSKLILRRAPTQEEFFRGSLSRNPVSFSSLNSDDPTVKDLIQHIADDLQMSDSAELIEILVANKILDTSLKLRVVHQTVWKEHLMGGGSSSSMAGTTTTVLLGLSGDRSSFTTTTTAAGGMGGDSRNLPPMVAIYRLAGVDGEATEDKIDTLVDPQEQEQGYNQELGDIVMHHIKVLLQTVQADIHDQLRRIRRDSVDGDNNKTEKQGQDFFEASPCLRLLQLCARDHAAKLLVAQAPTLLLRLLLDILKMGHDSNPTTEALQELIQELTSDINHVEIAPESDENDDLKSLLESIEAISLRNSELQKMIANLLPFLTYGKKSQSQELARHFSNNIDIERLEETDNISQTTFVQVAMSLPANKVCDSLRWELVQNGFVEKVIDFVVRDVPKEPPSWTLALSSSGDNKEAWRKYFCRSGLQAALKILTGLCQGHHRTQEKLGRIVQVCHWMEGTSDTEGVDTKGLGLLAETLLDELNAVAVAKLVDSERKKTRVRKKELAQQRRNKALLNMSSFGPVAGATPSATPRSGFSASVLAPVVGFFQSNPSDHSNTTTKSRKRKASSQLDKPSWLAEAEQMEDETGLTCAVCQEGRTLQPKELLGLYAYVKKVSISIDSFGACTSVDGTSMLRALPSELSKSFRSGCVAVEEWFAAGKAAASNLPSASSNAGRRTNVYTTTVSAGNGIHFNCHRRARQADRSHPKAPKSEWEGAALRNSRVNCNVILPLVSSHSSKVPLIAVDSALTEHHAAISNLLGTTPKSTVWTVLHDVRLLLLRMAYGESLSADCGGGSLTSNCQLIFYQFLMADMFDKDAQVDQPEVSMHARGLPAGLLAACAIVTSIKNGTSTTLTRGVADSSVMAVMNSIVFHNTHANGHEPPSDEQPDTKPHPKRQWIVGKDHFLKSLLICAGRRHARGIEGSGCQSNRSSSRQRASSFADWDVLLEEPEERPETAASRKRGRAATSTKPTVADFQNALRPMITLYAIFDRLSSEFTVSMNDVQIEESAQRLSQVISACQRCKGIHELLREANVSLDNEEIIELLQKGMVVAY